MRLWKRVFKLHGAAALGTRLTPLPVWQACLREAEASRDKLPRLWWGALAIGMIWIAVLMLSAAWLLGLLDAAG
jgi:hypothetical protein